MAVTTNQKIEYAEKQRVRPTPEIEPLPANVAVAQAEAALGASTISETTVQTPARPRRLDKIRVAKVVSLALHPFIISPLAIVLVLYLETGNLLAALGWAGLCAAFVVGPALLYLRRKLKRKRFTDADVSVREHRYGFYLFGGACMLVCFGVLLWLDAPAALIALFIIALGTIAVFAVVNRLWTKVSIHSGVAAGTATAVAVYAWPLGLLLALAATLVTWSRLVLKRHTPLQATLGWIISVVMVAVGMVVFL